MFTLPTKQCPSLLLTAAFASMLLLAACADRIAVTAYPTDREAQLPKLTQWCWAENSSKESPMEKVEPLGGRPGQFTETIHRTVENTLAAKGYRNVPCEHAEFVMDYRMGIHQDVAAVDEAIDSRGSDNPYGPRWAIGDDKSITYQGLVAPKEDIITVQHGTLHMAAFSLQGKILWHTSAEKPLHEQDSDEQRKQHVGSATEKLLLSFPAKENPATGG